VREKSEDKKGVAVVFLCTHNSRRSIMCEVWLRASLALLGVQGITVRSAGTEATCVDWRTVRALKRFGFVFAQSLETTSPIPTLGSERSTNLNPRYECVFHQKEGEKPMVQAETCDWPQLWSKTISESIVPNSATLVVPVCTSADEACPFLSAVSHRAPLSFPDPKTFDGTAQEICAYDTSCSDIALHMYYIADALYRTQSLQRQESRV